MEDANLYAVELRRFLITRSSSSSSSPRPVRHTAATAANSATRGDHNVSPTITDSSPSLATLAQNFSHKSTPLQTRMRYATEKVVPESPPPQVVVSENQVHRSKSIDSVESRDYVDALASSTFQDGRSATTALLSANQAMFSTDAAPVMLRSAHEAPRLFEDAQRAPQNAVQATQHMDATGIEICVEDPVARSSGALGMDEKERRPMHSRDVEGKHADAEVHAEIMPPVSIEVEVQSETPSLTFLSSPAHQTADLTDKDVALDTNSSSRHQVGVWRAIYGKEKWTGPRLHYLHGTITSEDGSILNREEHERSPAAAMTPPSEKQNSFCGISSRHGDLSQWAATRKTALEMLRVQLDSWEGQTTGSTHHRSQRRRPFLSPVVAANEEVDSEEPAVSDTFVNEGEEGKPIESVEAQQSRSLPRPVMTDVVPTALNATSIVNNGGVNTSHNSRRAAEDILDQLLSGASPQAPSGRQEVTSSEFSDSQVTSPLKSSRFIVRPTLSAEVSHISPVKNEAPSILADLYGTPDSQPTRPARTPIQAAVAREIETAMTSTSSVPSSIDDRRKECFWQGMPSECQGEYTFDMSAMDFRTVQTGPTSSSSSESEGSPPVRRSELKEAALMYPSQEQQMRGFFTGEENNSAVPILDTSQSNQAPVLHADKKVSVFPATAFNAWDVARVNRWRSKKQQTENATGVAPSSPPVDKYDANANPAALHQERVRREAQLKELAECTFHPTLSPGTRAMVRMVQEREIEKSLADALSPPSLSRPTKTATSDSTGKKAKRAPPAKTSSHTSVATPSIDPSTLKATLRNVYERLYPVELSAATSRRQILDQEMEYRRLAREELILLRQRAGVVQRVPRVRGVPHMRDSFDAFMSNILQTDWTGEHVTTSGRCGVSASGSSVIETSYMSPMAVALREEKKAKRKYNTRREAEMQQSHLQDTAVKTVPTTGAKGLGHSNSAGRPLPAAGTGPEETFRIALFDEFLLRQNAYYFNRARTVRDLERELTPTFTPSTTHKSARLVKQMVSRSLLNESMGPETSSLVIQRQRQHIPIASPSFVTKHQSPYKDPCTFRPQLSPAARAARAEERQKERSANKSTATSTSPSDHRKEFFERLYDDHQRMNKERAKAKEAAEEEEMEGVTFKPQLNALRNAQVKSVLDPKNYEQYQQYLQKKQQLLAAQRQARQEKSEEAEEVMCTFRPRTTKMPAYISKMAESFGVLRQQGAEF